MRLLRLNEGQDRCCLRSFVALIFCVLAAGCAVVEFLKPEGAPQNEEIVNIYGRTKLKVSSAADVMAVIQMPEYELLSQSKSVVASSGQKKKGYKRWFNMVAFDEGTAQLGKEGLESAEYELTAKRKYLFIVFFIPNHNLGLISCSACLIRETAILVKNNPALKPIEVLT